MARVVMSKPDAVVGGFEEVVIGSSGRTIDVEMGQDVTGWTARMVGASEDLPGVVIDVAGSIVAPASGGILRWTGVGNYLTQIGERSAADFVFRIEWTDSAGLVDSSDAFGLRFVVPVTGEDTNMNETAVQAIVDSRFHAKLMSNNYMKINQDVDLPADSTGIRSSGWSERVIGGCRAIGLPVGANKSFSYVTNYVVDPIVVEREGLSPPPMWSLPFDYRMVCNAATMNTTPAGECLMGIQVGHFGVTTPWSGREDVIINSGSPTVQLRYNFTRETWEIVVWAGVQEDGETLYPISVTDCTINPTFTPDLFITELRLKYVPAPSGGSVLYAFLNGVPAGSVNNEQVQALYSLGSEFGPGYFTTSGTNAAQHINDAIFFTGHFYRPWQLDV